MIWIWIRTICWNVWSMLMVYTTAKEPKQSFVISELDNRCCKTLLDSFQRCSLLIRKQPKPNQTEKLLFMIRLENENESNQRIDENKSRLNFVTILFIVFRAHWVWWQSVASLAIATTYACLYLCIEQIEDEDNWEEREEEKLETLNDTIFFLLW